MALFSLSSIYANEIEWAFAKLELTGGGECKIDLREHLRENAPDPFPETDFCNMREVLLFEEIFLGRVRVAYIMGTARSILRLATEGSILGATFGGVLGCANGKFHTYLEVDATKREQNSFFASTISAFFSILALGPAEPSIKLPLMEKIISRKAIFATTNDVGRYFSKGFPAAFMGYTSATVASRICEEGYESLLVSGIIDYRAVE